jgi:iron complex outermembrane receptor protein
MISDHSPLIPRSALSIMALIMAAPADALSQEYTPPSTSEDSSRIEEIVVTVRKVEESLMEVPTGITVINRKAIEDNQIAELAGIARLVPSLQIFDNVIQSRPNITMRGIATVQGAEPSVALLVDGIQAPSVNFFSQDLEDAESIEVLRGPQGALYGRGAIAGVILVNTKQPTNTLAGDGRLLVGNGDTYKASGTISGPIVKDRLLYKVSLSYNDFGGLVKNIGYDDTVEQQRSATGRVSLLYTPTDHTTVMLKADYLDYSAKGHVDWAVVTRDQLNDYSVEPNYNVEPFEDRIVRNIAVKIDHDTAFGTFTSISQNARADNRQGGDGEFSPLPLAIFEERLDTRAWNQDIRYSSLRSDKFNWMVGAFYQYREQSQPLSVNGEPGGPIDGVVLLDSNQYDESDAYAIYGSGTLRLDGGWQFTVALRNDIEKRFQVDRNNPTLSEIDATFKALQPQVSVTKEISENLVGYVSYGRGFRSGGFNAFADTLVSRPNAPYEIRRQYPKEIADNYEIGFKSRHEQFSLNVSAYYTDFENQQYFFFFPTAPDGSVGPARDIVTIPESEIKGLEIETFWSPTDNISFDVAVAITNARVRDDAFDGNRMANVVRDTINLGGEYNLRISDEFELNFRVDHQHQGVVDYDIQNTYKFDGVDLLNGRIALRKDNYEIALFGRNILSEKYPAFFLPDSVGDGISLRRRIRPFTFGIEGRFSF